MTIDSSEISVVVQGAIDSNYTYLTIASIRKHLPHAEIIVSTWDDPKNAKKSESLQCNQLLLNKDPGFTWCDLGQNASNNVNRQIVSTLNGLKKVKRKYAIKFRSDMIMIGTQFLDEFGNKYDKFRSKNCAVFKNRIITNNLYCADPYRTKFCFHISDWFQFGLTEDLLNLWDIPLQKDEDAYYFKTRPNPDESRKSWLFKFIPEQHIWISCLKKNGVPIDCGYFSDDRKENILMSDLSFANNVVIMDYEKSGIQFLKYDPYKHDNRSQMNHAIWQNIYRDHCNLKFECPKIDRLTKTQSHKKDPSKGRDWWRGNRNVRPADKRR